MCHDIKECSTVLLPYHHDRLYFDSCYLILVWRAVLPCNASSKLWMTMYILGPLVGTKRDKATLDDTTNRINKLLYKIRSIQMCGSLALNMCGVACGRLDLCYEMGFGGLWYGSTKYMRHGFIVPFLIRECILDYINYHMQLSETINYEKYIVVFIKYIPRIKP